MGGVRVFSTAAAVAGLGVVALLLPSAVHGQQHPSIAELLRQFEGEKVFWRQFQTAKAIVAANDRSVLPRLQPWLTHRDRHLRGNAAFIFAGLGDRRGFDIIVAILRDRSEERAVHNISSVGLPWIQGQIGEDRYYAAHLLGDLKDPRAVPILVPLLRDTDVNYVIPWSLGQIGDRSAIPPLIRTLDDADPNMRVLAIHALAELKARDALPRLRELQHDHARSNFDKLESVSEAAKRAITKLETAAAPP